MLDSPDDVLRPPRCVPTYKDTRTGGHERRAVDDRHVPFPKLDPDVSLDPWERIVLTDGEYDIVGRQEHLVELRADQAPLLILVPLHDVEHHAREASIFQDEA